MKQRYEFWEIFDLGEELITEITRMHHLRKGATDLALVMEVEKDYAEIHRKIINSSSTILDDPDVILIHSHFDCTTGKLAVCFGRITEEKT